MVTAIPKLKTFSVLSLLFSIALLVLLAAFPEATNGTGGLRAHLGGLVTGSGFAVGPEYVRHAANPDVEFRASARGSLRKFWLTTSRWK